LNDNNHIHVGIAVEDENITDDMKARRKRLIEEANWDDLLFWDKFRFLTSGA